MRNVLKWLGILIGGLLVLASIVIVSIYFITERQMNETYDLSVTGITIRGSRSWGSTNSRW